MIRVVKIRIYDLLIDYDMITQIIIIVLLIGIGILFSCGKGAFLIAGYNTMPKKEKAKYDVVALCKFMGKLMFLIASCVTIQLGEKVFPGFYLFAIGQFLLIVALIFALIYANTGGRFKNRS